MRFYNKKRGTDVKMSNVDTSHRHKVALAESGSVQSQCRAATLRICMAPTPKLGL